MENEVKRWCLKRSSGLSSGPDMLLFTIMFLPCLDPCVTAAVQAHLNFSVAFRKKTVCALLLQSSHIPHGPFL